MEKRELSYIEDFHKEEGIPVSSTGGFEPSFISPRRKRPPTATAVSLVQQVDVRPMIDVAGVTPDERRTPAMRTTTLTSSSYSSSALERVNGHYVLSPRQDDGGGSRVNLADAAVKERTYSHSDAPFSPPPPPPPPLPQHAHIPAERGVQSRVAAIVMSPPQQPAVVVGVMKPLSPRDEEPNGDHSVWPKHQSPPLPEPTSTETRIHFAKQHGNTCNDVSHRQSALYASFGGDLSPILGAHSHEGDSSSSSYGDAAGTDLLYEEERPHHEGREGGGGGNFVTTEYEREGSRAVDGAEEDDQLKEEEEHEDIARHADPKEGGSSAAYAYIHHHAVRQRRLELIMSPLQSSITRHKLIAPTPPATPPPPLAKDGSGNGEHEREKEERHTNNANEETSACDASGKETLGNCDANMFVDNDVDYEEEAKELSPVYNKVSSPSPARIGDARGEEEEKADDAVAMDLSGNAFKKGEGNDRSYLEEEEEEKDPRSPVERDPPVEGKGEGEEETDALGEESNGLEANTEQKHVRPEHQQQQHKNNAGTIEEEHRGPSDDGGDSAAPDYSYQYDEPDELLLDDIGHNSAFPDTDTRTLCTPLFSYQQASLFMLPATGAPTRPSFMLNRESGPILLGGGGAIDGSAADGAKVLGGASSDIVIGNGYSTQHGANTDDQEGKHSHNKGDVDDDFGGAPGQHQGKHDQFNKNAEGERPYSAAIASASVSTIIMYGGGGGDDDKSLLSSPPPPTSPPHHFLAHNKMISPREQRGSRNWGPTDVPMVPSVAEEKEGNDEEVDEEDDEGRQEQKFTFPREEEEAGGWELEANKGVSQYVSAETTHRSGQYSTIPKRRLALDLDEDTDGEEDTIAKKDEEQRNEDEEVHQQEQSDSGFVVLESSPQTAVGNSSDSTPTCSPTRRDLTDPCAETLGFIPEVIYASSRAGATRKYDEKQMIKNTNYDNNYRHEDDDSDDDGHHGDADDDHYNTNRRAADNNGDSEEGHSFYGQNHTNRHTDIEVCCPTIKESNQIPVDEDNGKEEEEEEDNYAASERDNSDEDDDDEFAVPLAIRNRFVHIVENSHAPCAAQEPVIVGDERLPRSNVDVVECGDDGTNTRKEESAESARERRPKSITAVGISEEREKALHRGPRGAAVAVGNNLYYVYSSRSASSVAASEPSPSKLSLSKNIANTADDDYNRKSLEQIASSISSRPSPQRADENILNTISNGSHHRGEGGGGESEGERNASNNVLHLVRIVNLGTSPERVDREGESISALRYPPHHDDDYRHSSVSSHRTTPPPRDGPSATDVFNTKEERLREEKRSPSPQPSRRGSLASIPNTNIEGRTTTTSSRRASGSTSLIPAATSSTIAMYTYASAPPPSRVVVTNDTDTTTTIRTAIKTNDMLETEANNSNGNGYNRDDANEEEFFVSRHRSRSSSVTRNDEIALPNNQNYRLISHIFDTERANTITTSLSSPPLDRSSPPPSPSLPLSLPTARHHPSSAPRDDLLYVLTDHYLHEHHEVLVRIRANNLKEALQLMRLEAARRFQIEVVEEQRRISSVEMLRQQPHMNMYSRSHIGGGASFGLPNAPASFYRRALKRSVEEEEREDRLLVVAEETTKFLQLHRAHIESLMQIQRLLAEDEERVKSVLLLMPETTTAAMITTPRRRSSSSKYSSGSASRRNTYHMARGPSSHSPRRSFSSATAAETPHYTQQRETTGAVNVNVQKEIFGYPVATSLSPSPTRASASAAEDEDDGEPFDVILTVDEGNEKAAEEEKKDQEGGVGEEREERQPPLALDRNPSSSELIGRQRQLLLLAFEEEALLRIREEEAAAIASTVRRQRAIEAKAAEATADENLRKELRNLDGREAAHRRAVHDEWRRWVSLTVGLEHEERCRRDQIENTQNAIRDGLSEKKADEKRHVTLQIIINAERERLCNELVERLEHEKECEGAGRTLVVAEEERARRKEWATHHTNVFIQTEKESREAEAKAEEERRHRHRPHALQQFVEETSTHRGVDSNNDDEGEGLNVSPICKQQKQEEEPNHRTTSSPPSLRELEDEIRSRGAHHYHHHEDLRANHAVANTAELFVAEGKEDTAIKRGEGNDSAQAIGRETVGSAANSNNLLSFIRFDPDTEALLASSSSSFASNPDDGDYEEVEEKEVEETRISAVASRLIPMHPFSSQKDTKVSAHIGHEDTPTPFALDPLPPLPFSTVGNKYESVHAGVANNNEDDQHHHTYDENDKYTDPNLIVTPGTMGYIRLPFPVNNSTQDSTASFVTLSSGARTTAANNLLLLDPHPAPQPNNSTPSQKQKKHRREKDNIAKGDVVSHRQPQELVFHTSNTFTPHNNNNNGNFKANTPQTTFSFDFGTPTSTLYLDERSRTIELEDNDEKEKEMETDYYNNNSTANTVLFVGGEGATPPLAPSSSSALAQSDRGATIRALVSGEPHRHNRHNQSAMTVDDKDDNEVNKVNATTTGSGEDNNYSHPKEAKLMHELRTLVAEGISSIIKGEGPTTTISSVRGALSATGTSRSTSSILAAVPSEPLHSTIGNLLRLLQKYEHRGEEVDRLKALLARTIEQKRGDGEELLREKSVSARAMSTSMVEASLLMNSAHRRTRHNSSSAASWPHERERSSSSVRGGGGRHRAIHMGGHDGYYYHHDAAAAEVGGHRTFSEKREDDGEEGRANVNDDGLFIHLDLLSPIQKQRPTKTNTADHGFLPTSAQNERTQEVQQLRSSSGLGRADGGVHAPTVAASSVDIVGGDSRERLRGSGIRAAAAPQPPKGHDTYTPQTAEGRMHYAVRGAPPTTRAGGGAMKSSNNRPNTSNAKGTQVNSRFPQQNQRGSIFAANSNTAVRSSGAFLVRSSSAATSVVSVGAGGSRSVSSIADTAAYGNGTAARTHHSSAPLATRSAASSVVNSSAAESTSISSMNDVTARAIRKATTVAATAAPSSAIGPNRQRKPLIANNSRNNNEAYTNLIVPAGRISAPPSASPLTSNVHAPPSALTSSYSSSFVRAATATAHRSFSVRPQGSTLRE